jgi:hypothetical protein
VWRTATGTISFLRQLLLLALELILVKTNSTINIIQFFLSHCVFQQEDQGISIQCNMKSISFPSLAYYRFFDDIACKTRIVKMVSYRTLNECNLYRCVISYSDKFLFYKERDDIAAQLKISTFTGSLLYDSVKNASKSNKNLSVV